MTVEILKRLNCPDHLIKHCKAVCKKALKLSSNFNDVDTELVKTGALLHDIGRCKTNGIDHAIIGAKILKELGFSEDVANIALRHIGAGIPREEAIELGLPPQDYIPITLEEKIVAHADNLVHQDKEVNLEFIIKKWKRKLGDDHPSIKRIIELHREIVGPVEFE